MKKETRNKIMARAKRRVETRKRGIEQLSRMVARNKEQNVYKLGNTQPENFLQQDGSPKRKPLSKAPDERYEGRTLFDL